MPKPKLAIISSRFPWPLDKGDKLRLYHQIKTLSEQFEIYLFSINDEKLSTLEQENLADYCQKIYTYPISSVGRYIQLAKNIFSSKPWQVAWFYSSQIHEEIKQQIAAEKIDLLYCQLSRTAAYKEGIKIPAILDYQDAFSLNYERTAKNSSALRKLLYQSEAKRMKAYEQDILEKFSRTTIISEHDKTHIDQRIEVVRNGVDTQYFKLKKREENFDLLFTGNLDYLPNKNAIEFIIAELKPRLVKKKADIKILIAGRTKLKHWKNIEDNNLIVEKNLEDIRTAYAQSEVFIAPLFTGAGLQNKILEAMSMGLAVVSSEEANASLNAQHASEIFIANEADDICNRIMELLDNDALREKISTNARQFVEENYSWAEANASLVQLLLEIYNSTELSIS